MPQHVLSKNVLRLDAIFSLKRKTLLPVSYTHLRLIVRKNGAEIYNRTALDNPLIYSGVIDMPAGRGHMTLELDVYKRQPTRRSERFPPIRRKPPLV